MAKKKSKGKDLIDRVVDEVDAQGERLKRIISMFCPDGTMVEFAKTPQLADILRDASALNDSSEDEQTREKCSKISEDVDKKESMNFELSLYDNRFWFQGNEYELYNSYIIFKAEQDDTPNYVQKESINDNGPFPFFYVDGDKREAILNLKGMKNLKDGKYDYAYIRLSELHAILLGDLIQKDDLTPVDFMVSFSKADGCYVVESIFDYNHNKKLLKQLPS